MNVTVRMSRRKQGHAALAALALAAAWLGVPQAARADVYGRLQIKVSLQKSRLPSTPAFSGVQLTLRDTSGVDGDITLKTGSGLSVLSPLLANTGWQLVRVDGIFALPLHSPAISSTPLIVPFALPKPIVLDVTPDAITNVAVRLDAADQRVAQVNDSSFATQTGNGHPRSRSFIQRIPATGNNPQNLNRVLSTAP